jgi:hypothetical protein
MDFSLVTAKASLDHVAGLVESTLTPIGRATHTATTLRQIGEVVSDMHLTPGHVRAAMILLAVPRDGDSPPIASRRITCGEIADVIEPSATATAHAMSAVLRAVSAALLGSADPRQQAISATAAREADELDAHLAAVASAPRGAMRGESEMDMLGRLVEHDRDTNDSH